jgi:hypothetical protein
LKIINLLFTGSLRDPKSQLAYKPDDYYDASDLHDLEIDSKKTWANYSGISSLKTDLDSTEGSLNVAGLSTLDSIFSAVGVALSQRLSDKFKIFFSVFSLGISLAASKIKIPGLSDEINFFSLGGRLLRSPLHILDSFFSVLGEYWADSKNFPRLAFSLAGLGLGASLLKKEKDSGVQFDYQTMYGTLGRSVIHHLQSMLSSSANLFFEKKPVLSSLIGFAVLPFLKLLPKSILDKEFSWKAIDGILAQGLFHMQDSVFASLGTSLAKNIGSSHSSINSLVAAGLTLMGTKFLRDKTIHFEFMKSKLPYPQLKGKLIRSLIHLPESFIFKIGSELGKSSQGLLLTILIMLHSFGQENKKIALNTFEGLTARLPHDMVQASLTQMANRLSERLPAPLLTLFGPMISYHLARVFNGISTRFNESHGLLRKNLIYFWENLLSSAAYKSTMKIIPPRSDSTYTGSLLADGRWITRDGRITPSMILGKQI